MIVNVSTRFIVLALALLLGACTWYDDMSPKSTSRSQALMSSLQNAPLNKSKLGAFSGQVDSRAKDVNYSDVLDPTKSIAAQISPNKAQQINSLVLSGQLSKVNDNLQRCKKVTATGQGSGECTTSYIQQQLGLLSQRTGKISSKITDPRVAKSLNTVCSSCQYQPKSKQICVESKTQTQQCPTCGQIGKEVQSFNQISKFLRQNNITFSENKVSCKIPQLR